MNGEAAGVAQAHYTPGMCCGSGWVLTGLLGADVVFRAVERLLNGRVRVHCEAAGVAQAHYTPFGSEKLQAGLLDGY